MLAGANTVFWQLERHSPVLTTRVRTLPQHGALTQQVKSSATILILQALLRVVFWHSRATKQNPQARRRESKRLIEAPEISLTQEDLPSIFRLQTCGHGRVTRKVARCTCLLPVGTRRYVCRTVQVRGEAERPVAVHDRDRWAVPSGNCALLMIESKVLNRLAISFVQTANEIRRTLQSHQAKGS